MRVKALNEESFNELPLLMSGDERRRQPWGLADRFRLDRRILIPAEVLCNREPQGLEL